MGIADYLYNIFNYDGYRYSDLEKVEIVKMMIFIFLPLFLFAANWIIIKNLLLSLLFWVWINVNIALITTVIISFIQFILIQEKKARISKKIQHLVQYRIPESQMIKLNRRIQYFENINV